MASLGGGLYRGDRVPVTSLGAVSRYGGVLTEGGLWAQSRTRTRERQGCRQTAEAGEPPRGGLRHDAPDAPRPAVTRTQDPVSFSLPARVIGLGARSGDTLPRGLPPAGSPVPPGAARGACRPLGLVCAGHEGQGQRALCRASSSLRPSRRQAQRRARGTRCPARAHPCHQVVTRQQSICHWQMLLTARASCPRVDRAIRDLIAAGAARCLPCGRLALVPMATWLCPGRDTCPSVAVERSACAVPVLC